MGYSFTLTLNDELMKKISDLGIDITESEKVREFILKTINEKCDKEKLNKIEVK